MTQAEADEFRLAVVEPLRAVRDHAHWRAVHRRDKLAGLLEQVLNAALRVAHETAGAIARDDRRHSCEQELRNRPDFNQNLETPKVFNCSCGKRWEVWSDEAFGVEWIYVPSKSTSDQEALS